MISFSYRTFKDYLNRPLDKQEIRFLIRTFSRSCVYLFLFLVFILSSGLIMNRFFGDRGYLIDGIGWVLSFIFVLPKLFLSYKYSAEPLRFSSSAIKAAWTCLLVTYGGVFISITSFVSRLVFGAGEFAWVLSAGTAMVFLTTIAIYAIPVFIAFRLVNKNTVISLVKFLKICFLAYILVLVLFIISFVLVVSGILGDKNSPGIFYLILVFLLGVMTFVAPIISLYRMKSIVPYINYEDDFERKRWENYFVFEIVSQLLDLALIVAKFVLRFFLRSR